MAVKSEGTAELTLTISPKNSVKGLTVCTPEFHAVAKQAQNDAEIDEKVRLHCDALWEIFNNEDIPDKSYFYAQRILSDIIDI